MASAQLPRYHLLESPLHGNEITHMLGRCVVHKSLPMQEFVPSELHPEDIVPGILSNPIQYDDISRILETAGNTTLRTKLTDLFGAAVSRRSRRDLRIEAGTVTSYEMSNPGDTLKILMANKVYRTQVLEKMDKLNEIKTRDKKVKILPMVVGMLTCKNMRVDFGAENHREVGIQGHIPVGTASGTSSELDSEVEITQSKANANRLEGKIRQEVIFALAYDEVRLERYLQKRSLLSCFPQRKQTSKSEFKHGDPIRSPEGINPYFGGTGQDQLPRVQPENMGSKLPFVLCYEEPADDDLPKATGLREDHPYEAQQD